MCGHNTCIISCIDYYKSMHSLSTSKNKQVILEEYQPHKSILTESVKVKFAIKPAKTDSLSPTVVT